MPTVVVTFEPGKRGRAEIPQHLPADTAPVYLVDLDPAARATALTLATAILARDTGKDLSPEEAALTGNARLIQFMTAGIDYIPLSQLPAHVPIASNGGAYADAMAEHALAMTLAAAKRLLVEHNALIAGQFNQFVRNRSLAGKTCAILGFGGIGAATARLMRAIGMRVHAINRRGRADGWADERTHGRTDSRTDVLADSRTDSRTPERTPEPIDWIGGPDDLPALLAAADVLIVSAPLTQRTRGMIGAAELACMKPDAILVNLARGELIQEAALFAHLQTHPAFYACLDAWWIEPVRHGTFRVDHPFLSLPNVIGSPHNSASVPGNVEAALRHALANIRRVLAGNAPHNLTGSDERML